MPINPDALGSKGESLPKKWSSRDSMIYALGVGAGTDELAFTTENTMDVPQRAFPTQAVTLADVSPAFGTIGTFNPAMLVHGEQRVVCHSELPPAGEVTTVSEITAIWDKGKGAVVEVTAVSTDVATGTPLFTNVTSAFIRGE